ncbi:Sca4 family spreading effector [Rickettsia endosymbiont of Rhinocyllus conicus]|uniref:Sca4 family spreading effector n=1 Tax=Rickettsia endosymbiont of Rhinocyllus conicus TaxID=3066252 RepID=UPI003132D6E5
MSKDPNVEEIIKEFDPIANKEFTEAEKQEQTRQEQELFESEGDSIFFSSTDTTPATATSTSSLSASALAGGISGDGFIDPITEAIRKEILEKQRDLIRNQLLKENAENPDLKPNFENDEKFRDFLRTLNEDPNKRELYDKALENPDLKKGLENIEIAGYKNVLASHSAEVYRENKIKEEQEELLRNYLNNDPAYSEEAKDKEKFRQFLANLNAEERQGLYDKALSNEQFKGQYENIRQEYANKYVGGFRSMQWENQISAGDLRSTVIKNDAGEEICTLAEKTHKTAPMTVYKQDGTPVTVNSYRAIDFPTDLEGKSGTMHLSLVAQNKEGKSNNALRFTAHYEADPHPDGTPKLKEISSPQPIKFMGKDENAVGYIEHGGEIYTLPVTRSKYEAMMKEVAVNKGQGVDVSQTIDQDIYRVQGGEKSVSSQQIDPANEKPIETKNTAIPEPQSGIASNQVPPITPFSSGQKPGVSQIPQPQQVEISQPQPQSQDIVDAATGLSQAMQNLLNQLNKDLKNENEPAGLIGEVAEKILGEKEASVDQKQAGINTLAENVLGNKELPEEVRIEGLGKILDTINNDNVLSEPEKAKLLGGITSVALDQDSLSQAAKKQIVEKITDSALELNTSDVRLQAINGITDAVLDSNLNKDEKGEIFEVISNVIEASKHDAQEKSQLKSDVLDKAREAGILSPEQQQLMQQNLDKIKEKQAAEETIKKVQGILYDPLSDAVKKTDAIKTITTDVLDGPAKAEIKGEIVEGITKEVAQSPLSIKDKVGIIEVVGEAIASHKDMSIPEKATIASFAEDGIVKSTAELKDKELMTKGLIDGIHKGIGNESPEITQGVVKSIKANAVPEERSALENIANEAILEREMQNLTQGLKGQNLEQDKPEKDIVKAARETMEALGNLNKAAEPGFEKGPVDDTSKQQIEKPIISEQEKVVQETSNMLSDVSNFVSNKVDKLRNILSASGSNFKTNEEKKAESEKQAKDLTEKFNEKSSTKDQLDFIQANLIDNKDLSKDARLKAIDNLLQEQVEKRGAAVSGQSQDKTEDVRTLSGKSELKTVSKDEPDIERAKMVVGKDKVNIKDNVQIMAKLTDAKNAIQLENPTISNVKAPNGTKKGQSFP